MSTAIWRSRNETVEVTRTIPSKVWKDTQYKIKRRDGTTQLMERSDIFLSEEEALIQELASILRQYRTHYGPPVTKPLCAGFLEVGAPFNRKLKALLEHGIKI